MGPEVRNRCAASVKYSPYFLEGLPRKDSALPSFPWTVEMSDTPVQNIRGKRSFQNSTKDFFSSGSHSGSTSKNHLFPFRFEECILPSPKLLEILFSTNKIDRDSHDGPQMALNSSIVRYSTKLPPCEQNWRSENAVAGLLDGRGRRDLHHTERSRLKVSTLLE
ncbi:unnamed protein product [Larinioides sclopetarius]|uniref:Uncharacterized protein n=1 Tax=Larinioides sclopetarius TaxID=280406 RepID=A0AAV2ABJ1_9ARAC